VRVIIGGCGRVGAHLARRFALERHEVAIIDKRPEAFARLGESFTGQTVRGFVFDKRALEEADAGHADAFIAVTSGDNSNVVSAVVCRDIFRVPRVVARIYDPRRAEIYRRLGIQTVSSVAWATNEIADLVLFPQLVRDLSLGDGEVQLVKVAIPPRIAGRAIAELAMAGEVVPFAIVRAGKSFIPPTHEPLREGDIVEAAVLATAMDKFQRLIAP